MLQHVVGGGDEIGSGVDERSVEIEDDGEVVHGASGCGERRHASGS